jgi:cobalt/nickel transport protein
MSAFQKRLLVILVVLALVSPIGVYLPMRFNAEDAWGEWSMETIQRLVGFIPEGMKKDSDLWKALVPDYNLGDDTSSFAVKAFSYILSGVIGIVVSILGVFGLSKLLVKKKQ